MSPLTKREESLPQDHVLIKTKNKIEDNFVAGGSNAIDVSIFWGIKELDKKDSSMWDPEDLGKIVWDDDIDFNIAEPTA